MWDDGGISHWINENYMLNPVRWIGKKTSRLVPAIKGPHGFLDI